MTWPNSIYTQRDLENLPGVEFDADNNKTLFAEDILNLGAEITAIETALGENLGGVVELINGIVETKLASKWPIGSAYINFTNSTNPSTLLGFGTWVLDSKGRVLVGKADSGTFGTAGSTIGSETVTLTTAQMPVHSHSNGTLTAASAGSHRHAVAAPVWQSGGWKTNITSGSSGFEGDGYTGYSGNHTHDVTGSTSNSGSGESHNNIQPSVVVYIWKRTA